ncbi:MAG: hypothetical protein ABIK79_09830 [Chloroflexota bacterium]
MIAKVAVTPDSEGLQTERLGCGLETLPISGQRSGDLAHHHYPKTLPIEN